jgi:hypothetical protein
MNASITLEEVAEAQGRVATFSVTDRHATVDDTRTAFDVSLHHGEILDAVF